MAWCVDPLNRLILDQALTSHAFQRMAGRLCATEGAEPLLASGLPNAGLAIVATLLSFTSRRPVCIITATGEASEEIYHDAESFAHPRVLHWPKGEILPYEREEPSAEVLAKELDVALTLLELDGAQSQPAQPKLEINWNRLEERSIPPLIVAPVEACLRKIAPLETLREACLELRAGAAYDLDQIAERLVESGYSREPMVEARGEFSMRGGIVDLFPFNYAYPVRLDFFGDELESIRYFDVVTQRSLKDQAELRQALAPPASLRLLTPPCREQQREPAVLAELLPQDTLFILDEPERWEAVCEKFSELVVRQHTEALKWKDDPDRAEEWIDPLPPEFLYAAAQDWTHALAGRPRVEHAYARIEAKGEHGIERFAASSFDAAEPSLENYLRLIRGKQQDDFVTVIVCDNNGQAMRLDELLREQEISAVLVLEQDRLVKQLRRRDALTGYPDIIIAVGDLNNGLNWREARLLLVTDREIFGRYKRRRVYKKVHRGGAPIHAAADLHRGDYVVHVDHGIGRFMGLRVQQLDGQRVDLLELQYAEGNKLLVPLEKIAHVQKYTAADDNARPALDKLGSNRWLKRKKKSQEDIEKMAQELVALYAKREVARRQPYGLDTTWQQEFEASFVFQETPDQLEAIRVVKDDLHGERPMDRLVCGDVGYGKTEVAIRAAFKVIQEGRQAAVLCPTTVLAQQHYNTFRQRFAEYPVKVEMLSRFRTPKQARETLKRLRLGETEIVVGTHRLLSKDVEFNNLGLIVVDEEQRFGVKHKERLKELRATVDVMTLTATPIPRTLYMALSGLRDMSLIQTAPANRLPIRTHIIHFDEEMIKEAILRELNRDGQIYFVHNRVHNIDEVAQRLREIVPEARIVIGHGQMSSHELEKVMLQFIEHKADILLCTTIIENGLDIPNCNTIIINRADAFGLAQLYQLRGRVGRDIRQAYCYLVTPRGTAVNEIAMKRLSTLEEFTELGHGFDIAMRDLEIRGSGNILGVQQHGVMMQIGFDLYCSMLQAAVERVQGRPVEEEPQAEVKWKADTYLPEDYVPVESQRVSVYKKLASLRSLKAVDDMADELRDRYGEPPVPAQNLLDISRLRILAARAGAERLHATPRGFRLYPRGDLLEMLERVARMEEHALTASVAVNAEEALDVELADGAPDGKLARAIELLASSLAESNAA
ncbi:transcription-repair coupling factor [Candidatus Sumerlaeota bacterium]|nr:transcription-repair coupling factor [Candidatus Sumerlaeota bacterium]